MAFCSRACWNTSGLLLQCCTRELAFVRTYERMRTCTCARTLWRGKSKSNTHTDVRWSRTSCCSGSPKTRISVTEQKVMVRVQHVASLSVLLQMTREQYAVNSAKICDMSARGSSVDVVSEMSMSQAEHCVDDARGLSLFNAGADEDSRLTEQRLRIGHMTVNWTVRPCDVDKAVHRPSCMRIK